MPAAMTNALQRLETALVHVATSNQPSKSDLRVINDRGLMPLTDVVYDTLINACHPTSTGVGSPPTGPIFTDVPVRHWTKTSATTWVVSGTGLWPGGSGAISIRTEPLPVGRPATLRWTSGSDAAYAGSNDGSIRRRHDTPSSHTAPPTQPAETKQPHHHHHLRHALAPNASPFGWTSGRPVGIGPGASVLKLVAPVMLGPNGTVVRRYSIGARAPIRA
jgi:hypothetical protein